MFLSKIWFFLIAVIAFVAITVALVMPRPSQRMAVKQENKGVRSACLITGVLLKDSARWRVQQASEIASSLRGRGIGEVAQNASKGEIVPGTANAAVRKELPTILKSDEEGNSKQRFIWVLDQRGRIVGRSNLDDSSYGNSVRGRPLVTDALEGYVRDDLWMMDDGLYRVAAAPLFTKGLDWAGAVIFGQIIDQDFAASMSDSIGANIGFYVAGKPVASNTTIQLHNDLVEAAKGLSANENGNDCGEGEIVRLGAGDQSYIAVNARLPGEAGELGAFYSVFVKQDSPVGLMGTLKGAKTEDLGFGTFPWIPVALGFIAVIGVGFFLMRKEVDSPMKRLNKDAVGLAQGDNERMNEVLHKGKFGSVARSVNIAIDKMHREAKAAQKDLDQLLGPAPDDDATVLPPLDDDGDLPAPPPPSEFKFGGMAPTPPPRADLTPPPSEVARKSPVTPPPPGSFADTPLATPAKDLAKPTKASDNAPPPIPGGVPAPFKRPTDSLVIPDPVSLPKVGDKAPAAIDADILGTSKDGDLEEETTRLFEGMRDVVAEEAANGGDEAATIATDAEPNYFEKVYQDFIELKKECGENVDNLTFERFEKKLIKNQDALKAKHGCKSVRFSVYKKDGKAALKASPVK